MKYYGLHWTSDDGTEIQARLDIDNLQLWARSCPRGGEWQTWRRLDVLRAADGTLDETVRKAKQADRANSAAQADRASQADRAANADNAFHANSADAATRADKAGYADKAAKADAADRAQSAGKADGLAKAVTIAISGAVIGSAPFNGKSNVNIATSPGADFTALQDQLKNLGNRLDGVSGSLSGMDGQISGLKSSLDALAKRLAALENADDGGKEDELIELLDRIMVKIWSEHCDYQDQGSGGTYTFEEYWEMNRLTKK